MDFFHIFLCRLLHHVNCNSKEPEQWTRSFFWGGILGAAMKLLCGINVLPLILKVCPFGSKVHFLLFSFLIAECSCKFFGFKKWGDNLCFLQYFEQLHIWHNFLSPVISLPKVSIFYHAVICRLFNKSSTIFQV